VAATAGVLLILGGAPRALADSTDTAEIRGVILITKRLTKRPVAPVAAAYHRGVAVQPGGPVHQGGADEDFAGAELGRVAIYLESAQDLPGAAVAATLNQKDRRFVEDTVVIPAGSSVSFPNLDPVFHNVFSLSRAKSFDLGNYPQNETRTVSFPKPGIVRVYCHLHPNMSASIVVAPNRWVVKPGPDGKYRLADVPPGEHTVVVWHKSAGFFRERVTVAAGQAVNLNFTIPIGAGPIGAGSPPDREP
jgi:plastocyanin